MTTHLLPAAVVEMLACPVCQQSIRAEAASLICVGCGRVYPIVDNIPVMIAPAADTTFDGKKDR